MEGKAEINLYTRYSHRQRTQQGVVVGNTETTIHNLQGEELQNLKTTHTHKKNERVGR